MEAYKPTLKEIIMKRIVKEQWTESGEIGHYKFADGSSAWINMRAEEHKVEDSDHTNLYVSVNFPGHSKTRDAHYQGPVPTQEEGKKIGEDLITKIIVEFEKGLENKKCQKTHNLVIKK